MFANDNIDKERTAEVYDLALVRHLERERQSGELRDTDRVSVLCPDDRVRLFSPFGQGVSDEVFNSICRANFIALNPERGEN